MKVLSTLLILFAYTAAFTQQDSAGTSLGEVVVTAQRIKEKEFDVPYSIKKVQKGYLQEMASRTAPEALQGVTGVFVQKTNHGGGSSFIRGLTGNQTLLLIDGIRLNNSTFRYGPNQYLNTIDPYTIDHIEIAKGTGSVQYGTDALGGVVHILTKEPCFTQKPSLHGKAVAKYLSGNMEKTVRGEVEYGSKKVAFAGGVTYKKFGDLIGGDTTGRQTPSGYDEWSFNSKAKFSLTQNAELTVAQQFLQQQHVPVYHKIKEENFRINEFDRQQRLLHYASLNIGGKKAGIKEVEIIASWQQGIEGRKSEKRGSNMLVSEKDKITTTGLTATVVSGIAKGWTANSGIEIFYDKIRSSRQNISVQNNTITERRGLYPDGATYGNYSFYSLHHVTYKKWILDGGLRFNTFTIGLTDTTLGNVKLYPSALVGNGALLYLLSKQHHLYATYSTGYRAPNIDDMGTLGIVDFRYEIPTNSLRPEKSANAELGYKFNAKKIKGNLALYYMQLSNLITRIKTDEISNGYPVYRKENTEEAVIKGVESDVTWIVTKRIEILGGLAYTYGQNNTKGEPLRRIPPLNGRLMSTYRSGALFSRIEVLFASRQARLAGGDKEDNRIPAGGTPGWEVLNLYAGYEFPFITCQVGVQNIFNRDYRTHGSGINGVGRSVWLSASLHF